MTTRLRMALVTLFAAISMASCASTPETRAAEESPVEQAQAAYTAEDWPATAQLYSELLKTHSANTRYWYRLAVAQRYLGNLAGAMDSLEKGSTHGLPVSYADYERAKVAATDGKPASAIAYLKSAVAAGLSGADRILENEQLVALKGTDGFEQVLDQLDANANPCRDEMFHQFDFWLGTWEVATADGATAGRNVITARESGCLLLEEWTSASGTTGTSMNYYDAISAEWTQVWISPGLQLRITGGLENGSMVLTGSAHYIQNGTTSDFRGTWTPLDDGRVRQFFEQRDAEGKWNPWFEGFYRRITDVTKPD